MEPEKEVSFFKLIRELNRWKIRYLIIGRRAVILYGGPVLTADTDLWIHPEDKKRALSLLLDKLGLEISHSPDTKKPIGVLPVSLRRGELDRAGSDQGWELG